MCTNHFFSDLGVKFEMLEQHRWENWIAHLQLWRSHPVNEALNTHEGGYVLAIALSIVLPVLRGLLRTYIWEVSFQISWPTISGINSQACPEFSNSPDSQLPCSPGANMYLEKVTKRLMTRLLMKQVFPSGMVRVQQPPNLPCTSNTMCLHQ